MKINGTVRDVFATLQPLAQSGETDYIANTGLFPEQGRSAGRRGWKWAGARETQSPDLRKPATFDTPRSMANLPTERRRLTAMARGTNMLDMLRRGAGLNDPHEVPRISVFERLPPSY
jgi:hypothetical protein